MTLTERQLELLYKANYERKFPRLKEVENALTSPVDAAYNCFAWALGENERVWEPFPHEVPGSYWPPDIPRNTSLSSFTKVFELCGYEQCENSDLEEGIEKVALYAKSPEDVTHATKQLSSGVWASKLGFAHDIEHEVADALEGSEYGEVVRYMKRQQS